MPHFELSTFSVASSAYLAQLGRMYLRRRWPWLAAPVAACCLLAFALSDVRWGIVGLMTLFVAIPMFLSLAYINYALSPEARWSVIEKSVSVGEQGVTLHFADARMYRRDIPWRDIDNVAVGGDSFLLMLRVRRFTFLMLPFSVLEREGISLRDFALFLNAHAGH